MKYANDLNNFYSRFDVYDFSNEISTAKADITNTLNVNTDSSNCTDSIVVTEKQVKREFDSPNRVARRVDQTASKLVC